MTKDNCKFEIRLTGVQEQDIPLLITVNKGAEIDFGIVQIPAKIRHSSHHKQSLIAAYNRWAALTRMWNLRGRGNDDPANKLFVVRVR